MGIYKTPLGQLMDISGLRSCDLSKALHVDRSLIGKWKNGVRSIPTKSCYIESIISALQETQFQRNQLDDFFSDLLGDKYVSKHRNKCIKNFLLNDNFTKIHQDKLKEECEDYLYKSEIFVYHGIEGRKKAFRNMLEYAVTLSGKTLTLHDSTNFCWIYTDIYYLDRIQKLLLQFLEHNRLNLIITMQPAKGSITKFINFLYLYAFDKPIDCYYILPYGCTSIVSTYVLEDEMALTGYCCESDLSRTYTQISSDSLTVMQHTQIIKDIIKNAHTFFQNTLPTFSTFQDYVSRFCSIPETIYVFTPTISFFSLEDSLMDKILDYNGLSEPECDQIHIWRDLFQKEMKSTIPDNQKHIYFVHDFEAIRQMKQMDYVIYMDNFLSSLPTIQVKQEDFRSHLSYICNQLEAYNHIEIGITKNQFSANPNHFSFRICKNKCWFVGTTNDTVSFTADKYMINMQYLAAQDMWDTIPQLLKSKKEVLQILQE